jgi:hypothetical protein
MIVCTIIYALSLQSVVIKFLRSKPVVLASVLRLQQCVAMSIMGGGSAASAFWDRVQDARYVYSQLLTARQPAMSNMNLWNIMTTRK